MEELVFCMSCTCVNKEEAEENALRGMKFSWCLLSFQKKMQSNLKFPKGVGKHNWPEEKCWAVTEDFSGDLAHHPRSSEMSFRIIPLWGKRSKPLYSCLGCLRACKLGQTSLNWDNSQSNQLWVDSSQYSQQLGSKYLMLRGDLDVIAPLQSNLETEQCRLGKHTHHEWGQTQCGRDTASTPHTRQWYLFAVFLPPQGRMNRWA